MDHGGTDHGGVRVKRVSNDDANARSVRRVRHANQRGREGEGGERGDDRASTSNGAIVLLLSVHSCHLISFSLSLEGTAQGVLPSARTGPSSSPRGGPSTRPSPCINTLPRLSLTLLSSHLALELANNLEI